MAAAKLGALGVGYLTALVRDTEIILHLGQNQVPNLTCPEIGQALLVENKKGFLPRCTMFSFNKLIGSYAFYVFKLDACIHI